MGGKRLPRDRRLATGAQLWVLNRAGKLKLVFDEELEPISNGAADRAIKRGVAEEKSS